MFHFFTFLPGGAYQWHSIAWDCRGNINLKMPFSMMLRCQWKMSMYSESRSICPTKIYRAEQWHILNGDRRNPLIYHTSAYSESESTLGSAVKSLWLTCFMANKNKINYGLRYLLTFSECADNVGPSLVPITTCTTNQHHKKQSSIASQTQVRIS